MPVPPVVIVHLAALTIRQAATILTVPEKPGETNAPGHGKGPETTSEPEQK